MSRFFELGPSGRYQKENRKDFEVFLKEQHPEVKYYMLIFLVLVLFIGVYEIFDYANLSLSMLLLMIALISWVWGANNALWIEYIIRRSITPKEGP